MHLMMNGATRTRAYYPTPDGRQQALGSREAMASNLRVIELDHTIDVASVMFELAKFENVGGIQLRLN